jgi:hypothetical protein
VRRENDEPTVALCRRRLAATPVVSVGFVSGWLTHGPSPPSDTITLLRAEGGEGNQHFSSVISDTTRIGDAAGSAPVEERRPAPPRRT